MQRRIHATFLVVCLAWTSFPASMMAAERVPAVRGSAQGSAIQGRVKNAVTGQYLNNARVTVAGTDVTAFTDLTGAYRLVNLPSGPVVLEVFYTDLDLRRVPVDLVAGQTADLDVELTSVARYGADSNVVQINPFVVSSEKEADATAVATNEQRFAPNIKNAVATDSQGDILGSNVGEFLKLLPGVSGEYSGAELIGISVRGFGGGMTSFTSNGAPMVSAWFLGGVAGGGRDFNINTMAMNDVSRVEVTKVPTPAMPADTLGGSVNMVSKSAFERSTPQLRVGLSLAANHENLTLDETPHSNGDQNTRKVLAGFDFDYVLPLSKNFGIVVAGMQSHRFNEQHHSTMTYSAGGTATGASFDRPYLQSYAMIDSPRTQIRRTLSLNADWRLTSHAVLSFTSQLSRYKNYIGALNWTFSPGTVGTSAVAGGVPLQYGPDFVKGATGRGSVTMNGGGQTYGGSGSNVGLSFRHDDGTWQIEASVNHSVSEIYRANRENGTFGGLAARLASPVRVSLEQINAVRPEAIQAHSNAGSEVNLYDISNFVVTSATDTPVENRGGMKSASLNVMRRLRFLPFPTSLQVGGAVREQTLDARRGNLSWSYLGPDGSAATLDPAAPFLMQVYKNQDSHFGFRNVPWISPSRAWAAYQADPGLFAQTPAQLVAAESFRVANSEYIAETVEAYYMQADIRLFSNRLRLLTGVRREGTTDEGEGMLFDPNAVYVRNADGTFARNAAGARIRRPEAGAAGSMDELRLVRLERAYKARRTYDGFYPSLHASWQFTDNLLARFAYAKTYGRPDFTDIIPSATINELDLGADQSADPNIAKGTITVRNTGLQPWTADNYDLSLEYYSSTGGVISGYIFLKEIQDFFGDAVRLASAEDLAALGLDSRYLGWNLVSKFNSGSARIRGTEVNVRHSLRTLGRWGRYFSVFGNITKLELEGGRDASFRSFIPKTANWGFSFNWQRVAFLAKWNYRGRDRRVAQPLYGPDGYEFFRGRTNLDLSFSYSVNPRISVVANANNVFNVPQRIQRYGSATPAYARQWRQSEFGVALALGVKGTF